jgi:hypothetical protein
MSEQGMEWATIEVLTAERDLLLEALRQIDNLPAGTKGSALAAMHEIARAAIAKVEGTAR